MFHFIEHHGIEILASYFLFAVLVGNMPAPSRTTGGYAYAYRVLNSILQVAAANIKLVPGAASVAALPGAIPETPAQAKAEETKRP